MNNVTLIGRLGKDIEMHNGAARTSIAVTRNYKDKQTGKYEADWINLVAFGKTAELMEKHFSKGSSIAIKGAIRTGSYEKDGVKHYTMDVVVEGLTFIEKGNGNDKANRVIEEISNKASMIEDDDLPF